MASLLLCLVILRVAVVVGKRLALVDRPDQRKTHKGDIPLVGGASIFLTFLAMQFTSPAALSVILAGGLLLLVGIADDYLDLSPRSRLVFQTLAAAILVWVGGYQITSLGGLVSEESILLSGVGAALFSIVCVIGVINATNMIDGADGLAGGIVSLSVAALLTVALLKGADPVLVDKLLVVLGATLAFLLFNSGVFGHGQKVFLGDSGSMFLGVLLASYYICMSQGDDAYISPVVAGWIFGLPLMDSISVMVGRVLNGKSPLRAGRDHLHHRLMESGLSPRPCVAFMLILHAALVCIGLVGNHFAFSNQVMFWGFVSLVVAYHFISPLLIAQIRSGRLRQKTRTSN